MVVGKSILPLIMVLNASHKIKTAEKMSKNKKTELFQHKTKNLGQRRASGLQGPLGEISIFQASASAWEINEVARSGEWQTFHINFQISFISHEKRAPDDIQ